MSPPRLVVRGLCKQFGTLRVLDGLELDLAPGEVLAVRGQSGSGKSTLLNLLGLLDQPSAGSIALDGRELTGLSPRERTLARRGMGFVFQAYHLLPEFSTIENVLMAARAAQADMHTAMARAQALLAAVGMAERAKANVTTLSGGERQRVAVCRALLLRPGLLLADEPTGNLDPTTAETVLDELLRLAKADGAAIIIVTHDATVAARADRRLELRGGRLHAEGGQLPAEAPAPATAAAPGQS